jgi:DNA-binding LacI/PurR family transcriptional regulator
LDGFREAMNAVGAAVNEQLVVDGGFTLEGGRRAVGELLARGDFTAVFASNDLMAIGATRGLLDAGVRVPHDVSVAGFDDIEMAAYAPVPLTTMHVPTAELGRLGARLLLSTLRQGTVEPAAVDGRLVQRESVGRPRA